MNETIQENAESRPLNPQQKWAWIIACVVVFIVISGIALQHQAQNHPQGTLESASTSFFETWPDAPQVKHLYTTSLKRTPRYPAGALSYYQTPKGRLQIRWQVQTQWGTSVGIYGFFWSIHSLCWENPAQNASPCHFEAGHLNPT